MIRTDTLLRHVQHLASRPDDDQITDRELLWRYAKHRDQNAFAVLVHRHGPMVLRVGQRVLQSLQDAEDVGQATFLVLATKASSGYWKASVAGWLHQAAYQLARKLKQASIRRTVRERRHVDRQSEDPLEEMTARELQAALDEELAQLPEKYRAPLVLCFLEGATRDEAARQIGCPLGTLKSRVERGRELLHRRLAVRGLTLSAALCAVGLTPAHLTATCLAEFISRTIHACLPCFMHATNGIGTASAAAGLARVMLRTIFFKKLWTAGACFLGVCVLLTGMSLALPVQTKPEDPVRPTSSAKGEKQVTNNVQEVTDWFGDPLPAEALARLGTERLKQGSVLKTVVFTSDGKTVISAGYTREVNLWDGATGKKRRSIAIPEQNLTIGPGGACLALSPDDRILAVGLPAGLIFVLELSTGKLLWQMRTGASTVEALAFSPDGKILASCGGQDRKSGEVQLWDVTTGKERHRLEGHKATVDALAYAPDGKLLATAGRDRNICLWEAASGARLRVLPYPAHNVPQLEALAISSDSSLLASGDSQGTIILWNIAEAKAVRQMTLKKPGGIAFPTAIRALTFLPRSHLLASGSDDGTARLWNIESGQGVRRLRGREALLSHGSVNSMSFAPDGQTIACGLQSGAIALHRVDTGELLHPEHGHLAMIDALAISPDGSMVATAGAESTIRLWDRATGKLLRCLDSDDPNGVRSLAWSPDGKHLAAATALRQVLIWALDTGRRLHQLQGRFVAFAPDGRLIISGAPGGAAGEQLIEMRDIASGRQMRIFARQAMAMGSISLSHDGALLAWTGWNPRYGTLADRLELQAQPAWNMIHICETATGKELIQFGNLTESIRSLTMSPDGKTLASVCGRDGKYVDSPPPARLWEVATGKERGQSAFHVSDIEAAAFSPDGSILATAGTDFNTVLVDLTSGKAFASARGHRFPVHAVAFTPDGRSLVTASMDTTALVFDLSLKLRRRPEPSTSIDNQNLEQAWTALAGDDAVAAYRGIWTLRQHPKKAVALLQQKLHAIEPANPQQLSRLIKDLDSEQFAARSRAERDLQQLGEAAMPAIQSALASKPSLEMRQRMERTLEHVRNSPATIQRLRAVEVLEWIAVPQARQMLEMLGQGVPEARLTQQAKAALARQAKH